MTWRRPGDKVLSLEQRLASLERSNRFLQIGQLIIIGLHLQALSPLVGQAVHIGAGRVIWL